MWLDLLWLGAPACAQHLQVVFQKHQIRGDCGPCAAGRKQSVCTDPVQTWVVTYTLAARGCFHWEVCHGFSSMETSHLLKCLPAVPALCSASTKLCLTYSVCWPWCARNGWMLWFQQFSSASSPEIPSVPPAAHNAAVVQNGERKFLRICKMGRENCSGSGKWGEKTPQDVHSSVGLAVLASGGQTRNSKKSKDWPFPFSPLFSVNQWAQEVLGYHAKLKK